MKLTMTYSILGMLFTFITFSLVKTSLKAPVYCIFVEVETFPLISMPFFFMSLVLLTLSIKRLFNRINFVQENEYNAKDLSSYIDNVDG